MYSLIFLSISSCETVMPEALASSRSAAWSVRLFNVLRREPNNSAGPMFMPNWLICCACWLAAASKMLRSIVWSPTLATGPVSAGPLPSPPFCGANEVSAKPTAKMKTKSPITIFTIKLLNVPERMALIENGEACARLGSSSPRSRSISARSRTLASCSWSLLSFLDAIFLLFPRLSTASPGSEP